jgi:soluble lytic murein transglycosylase-like protein
LYRCIGVLALLAAVTSATAQPVSPTVVNACARHVAEASNRSGLSADIVLRVMMAESGGNARIVSSKRAMGCMQIMPATWAYLTSRYQLGPDPFDARRNMIGGAMYLAELVARYGMPGALAAYNAGPGRYERYAAGTATLPAETITYTARIGASARVTVGRTTMPRWQEASLFLARSIPALPSVAQSPAATKEGRGNQINLFPLAPLVRDDAADPDG